MKSLKFAAVILSAMVVTGCDQPDVVYRDRVETVYVENKECGTLSRYASVDQIEDYVECSLTPFLGEERADHYADMIEDVASGEYVKESDSLNYGSVAVGAVAGAAVGSSISKNKVKEHEYKKEQTKISNHNVEVGRQIYSIKKKLSKEQRKLNSYNSTLRSLKSQYSTAKKQKDKSKLNTIKHKVSSLNSKIRTSKSKISSLTSQLNSLKLKRK